MEPGVGSDLGVVLTALMVGFGVGVVALDPRLDEAFGLALATVERDDFVARAVFLPAKEAVREGFVLVAIGCDHCALHVISLQRPGQGVGVPTRSGP